jgi:hydrogenase maturation protease
MNTSGVEQIANAVLYEGYILYPYRPSAVKNRQRFNFGVLYPPAYCDPDTGSDSWWMRTECLATGGPEAALDVKVRFLQLAQIWDWSQGHERDVTAADCRLGWIAQRRLALPFSFPEDSGGEAGRMETLAGELEISAARLEGDLFRVTLRVTNLTAFDEGPAGEREEALLRSLVSVHSLLQIRQGAFVSLIDPPDPFREAAAGCRNVGTWPVLAGAADSRDTLLSSPIILYDYPRIAAESPGDLFDGTEIDEILALRILTMTDQEKAEVRHSDDRARKILERTEAMPPEHFQKLHGAMRQLRPRGGEGS